jgi:hypothetical protein
MTTRASCLLALTVLLASGTRAQTPVPPVRRQLQGARVEQAPVLDGVLDDAAWKSATFTSDFVQREPDQGLPSSLRTEVGIVYDDSALYIGARMYSDKAEDIETVLTRRDDSGRAERIIVSLDTWRDRRTAYSFAVTAAGVRVDWYSQEDQDAKRDVSFNPVWEARTRLLPDGWVAEMRIPFSQLRFSPSEEQVWGINLNRYIPRRNEDAFWVLVPRDVTAWSSWFGELRGIRGIAPSPRIELLPYATADVSLYSGANPREGTPFASRPPYTGGVGLDAKMGIGPNLTLDATFNPDFGQVELDPAQVNLTAFEVFFDERRPFFVEGNQHFAAPFSPTYFYSRRIGAAPRLSASGDYVETPRSGTLLGATKLTGRLPSGLSLGVLGALTDRSWADTWNTTTDEVGRQLLEPRTGWGVARVQQELGTDGSLVGATLTGVFRDNLSGEGRTGDLVRQAYAGGLDWSLRFLKGEYVFSGYLGGSYQSGTPASLLRLQRSSARFYQRPDQDYVRLDPEATSLSGYTLGARVARQNATHWVWNLSAVARSPGFELNDIGQLASADDLQVSGNLTWRDTTPGRFLRKYSVSLVTSQKWNFGGVYNEANVGLSSRLTLPNFWTTSLGLFYFPRALSDSFTRGGPLMRSPQGANVDFTLQSNEAETLRWGLTSNAFRTEVGSWGASVSGMLSVQPIPRFQLSLEPIAFASADHPQYVATRPDGREETYGLRYIFSTVHRRELALRMRLNLYLTPELSLEAYAEPFASSGRFSDIGELASARGLSLRRYGEDGTTLERLEDGSLRVTDGEVSFSLRDPDFNVRSFRGNVVLRWEFRPGSTLFFVWQQDRGLGSALGDALAPRSLGEALLSPGRHTFALKLSWWLPVG